MPIGTIEVPVTSVTDEPLVCIPVNVDWIPALLAMVSPARYPEFWAGTLEENRRARLEVQNLLYLISTAKECGMVQPCCEDQVYIYRIDPVTGRLQRSSDDGTTWTKDPADPVQVITKLPPLVNADSDHTKCDAATNFSENFNQVIAACSENIGTAITIFELAAAVAAIIIDIIVAILTEGTGAVTVIAITDAIFAACAAAFAEGKTAFDAYWTVENKDKVLCAAYCKIGDDGQFTEAQWNAFRSKVKVDLPASAARDMVLTTVNAGGFVGGSNMASYGAAAEADCSSCNCNESCAGTWRAGYMFDGIFHAFGSILSTTPTEIVVQSQDRGDGAQEVRFTAASIDECCCLTTYVCSIDTSAFFNTFCDCATVPDFQNKTSWTGTPVAGTYFDLLSSSTGVFTVTFTFDGGCG